MTLNDYLPLLVMMVLALVFVGAAVLINGHISICDDVFITMHSTVLRSIDEPGKYSSSFDTDKAESWGRNAVRFRRLDEHLRRRKKG